MDVLDLISNLSLFESLSFVEKQNLADMDHTFVRFDAGETILREKAPSTAFYILIKGSVRVSKTELPGVTIALLHPGAIFGEMGYLTGHPRSTNVIADEDAIALKLSEATLKQLRVETREKIKDKLIEILVKRIRQMNEILLQRSR